MTFTEQLEADLHNVFLNPAEFGETINLNGRAMMAVVEAFDVEFDHAEGFRPGVSLEGVALHVAESDAPDEFRSGREVRFNGEVWFVLEANRDGCLRTIRIYRELS
ncbi:MAG: nitrate reductase [Desulfovibrionaceae bacterium]|nr:MAG: nitrate reductase [Desulfovibrionaceae bacterium]